MYVYIYMHTILTAHQRSMPLSSLSSNTIMILESSNIIYLFLSNIFPLLSNSYSFGCLVSISLNIFPDTLQEFFIDITCYWKLISFRALLDKVDTENLSDWKFALPPSFTWALCCKTWYLTRLGQEWEWLSWENLIFHLRTALCMHLSLAYHVSANPLEITAFSLCVLFLWLYEVRGSSQGEQPIW